MLNPNLLQACGYQTSEDCLREQALLTPKAYISRPYISGNNGANWMASSLLCCTWGDGGASALEVASLTYKHNPAYAVEYSKVVECVW